MRRDGNDQFRRLLESKRRRIPARGQKLAMQFRRGFLKLCQENAIQTDQGVAVIQILEREPKRQRKSAVTPRIGWLIYDWQAARLAEARTAFPSLTDTR